MVTIPYNVQNRLDRQGSRMQEVNPDPLGVVTIRDNVGNSVELTASLGRTESQEFLPGVAITNIRYQDFIVTASELDFGAGPVTPQHGWQIERQNGEIYTVISMGDNNPPREFITATKKRMRIHTELTRKATP